MMATVCRNTDTVEDVPRVRTAELMAALCKASSHTAKSLSSWRTLWPLRTLCQSIHPNINGWLLATCPMPVTRYDMYKYIYIYIYVYIYIFIYIFPYSLLSYVGLRWKVESCKIAGRAYIPCAGIANTRRITHYI